MENRKLSQSRQLLSLAATSLLLASCATGGGFASKSAPVDYAVTLQRVCVGLNGLDAVWKGVAPGLLAAGKITQANIDTEAATIKVLGAFCDPTKPPVDLTGAVAAVAVASVDMGQLIGALSK